MQGYSFVLVIYFFMYLFLFFFIYFYLFYLCWSESPRGGGEQPRNTVLTMQSSDSSCGHFKKFSLKFKSKPSFLFTGKAVFCVNVWVWEEMGQTSYSYKLSHSNPFQLYIHPVVHVTTVSKSLHLYFTLWWLMAARLGCKTCHALLFAIASFQSRFMLFLFAWWYRQKIVILCYCTEWDLKKYFSFIDSWSQTETVCVSWPL